MASATGEEREDDHYEVLGLPSGEEGARLTLDQIEKAYRTQSRLRHPDKRPDDPNATADFQRLAASYNLLRDEPLRRQFDARLCARREAAARAAAAGVKRRKAVSDLEERERAAAAAGGAPPDPREAAKRKDKEKSAAVQRELEEFFAGKRAAAAASASTATHGENKGKVPKDNESMKTDKAKMLKVSWEGGADYYTATKLQQIFKQFGDVEDIVIKTKRSRSRGSAIVVMASKEVAQAAVKNQVIYHALPVPLSVGPVQESSGFPTKPFHMDEPKTSNIDGAGFNDLEASVMRKLQEVHKRKQSGP